MTVPSIPLWRQIQRENFIRFEPLADFLELSDSNRKKILQRPNFPLNVPKRLAAKIAKNTLDDPILRQCVPLQEELLPDPRFVLDPVQDLSFRKTPKLLQKYQGRALLITNSACAVNCRFCFRQNYPYETEEKGFEKELAHIAQDPTLSEIILSGGDPLSLSDTTFNSIFRTLDTIPHIKRIRFHTRFPIGIPERIDDSFLNLLSSSSKQIVFIIHSNHPLELDADVRSALKKVQSLGIPLLNHTVLLKGVNDNEQTLLALSETLTNAGILPYYLNMLDPVRGTAHFDTSEQRAKELIRHLQSNTSGYGIPRLVREIPGEPSKTYLTY